MFLWSSYAVVLWEMVTGEKPYNGLSFFVVAYGVGHGTLSLPIPEGCPDPLVKLMKGKIKKDMYLYVHTRTHTHFH